MRHYLLIQRPSLPVDMRHAIARLEDHADEVVIADYNAQCRLGFTGVYAHAIHVLALHQQLKRRYGKGPLTIDNNCLLTFKGCVSWDGVAWAMASCENCECGHWRAQ